jgi:ABC-type polysaccharide/polyol phosphate export permease
MFIAWFFTVIFILMSGLFTPIESMPNWAQQVTLFNPIRYFVEIIRMVMLKGATFSDISRPFFIIAFYAFIINGFAVLSYKKPIENFKNSPVRCFYLNLSKLKIKINSLPTYVVRSLNPMFMGLEI